MIQDKDREHAQAIQIKDDAHSKVVEGKDQELDNAKKKINLSNFKLTFRSKYRAADIEPKKNSIVPGGLLVTS